MYEVKVANGNNSVFYITEEEKLRVLKARMEQERKAKRKNVSAYVKQHRLLGALMFLLGIACLFFGMPGVTILCAFFGVAGFLAKEEDEEWEER